ncbi:MAG: DUF3298 and DUF4163 domain-containing protein [Ignavibacteriae bacterium]|nr:DUF3298 and DUF4163 domain-containing protein [Ignavibacteriota bacterium]
MNKVILLFVLLITSVNLAFSGIDIDTVKFIESKKEYNVEMYYPKIRNESSEGARGFNKAIAGFVEGNRKDFLKDIKSMDYKPDMPSEYFVNYDVSYSDDHFVSVVLYTYYFTGGAHGSTIATTFNYDIDYNQNLKLSDLFEGNYLNIISDYCIKEIMKDDAYADADWVKEGASAKEENFKAFNLNEEGLLIHFQQYQVLPYAAGMPDVLIPQNLLKGVVRKDGLLMR